MTMIANDQTEQIADVRSKWYTGTDGDWAENRGHVTYPSRSQVLELAVQLSRPIPGHIAEFGVWQGHSVRVIRDELRRSALWDPRQFRKKIHAFDSFEGLASDYESLPAGTFATPVPTLRGVSIHQGFFEQTLTPELADEIGSISLAHLDADLYDSTVTVLDWLTPMLHAGSLLLFDEFVGDDPAEERAFIEWSQATGIRTELLAFFGREPSGRGSRADRRALFQVVGTEELAKAPPLLPARLRRKLFSKI